MTPVETMEPMRMIQMTRVVSREETCCSSSMANKMPARGALKPAVESRDRGAKCVDQFKKNIDMNSCKCRDLLPYMLAYEHVYIYIYIMIIFVYTHVPIPERCMFADIAASRSD